MFVLHRIGMSCLQSPTTMVRMLDTSQGPYGPCSWHWGTASPHFSSVPRGCFTGTRTFGVCMWSSMRGQQPIIFTTSVTWSRIPHRGGCLREAWERLHEKLWHCYYMKQGNKWSNHSTTTSQAAPKKELKLSLCLPQIVTTSGASPTKLSWLVFWSEILMSPSRRSIY
jgi:hypothetical protein